MYPTAPLPTNLHSRTARYLVNDRSVTEPWRAGNAGSLHAGGAESNNGVTWTFARHSVAVKRSLAASSRCADRCLWQPDWSGWCRVQASAAHQYVPAQALKSEPNPCNPAQEPCIRSKHGGQIACRRAPEGLLLGNVAVTVCSIRYWPQSCRCPLSRCGDMSKRSRSLHAFHGVEMLDARKALRSLRRDFSSAPAGSRSIVLFRAQLSTGAQAIVATGEVTRRP